MMLCGAGKQEPAADPTDPEETPTVDGTRIEPIPSTFDPMNLEDCVFPVSFTNDDIELNDEGTLVLHLTIWEQEVFDAAEITALQEGDTIVVSGKDIAVTSLERVDNAVHINGGLANGDDFVYTDTSDLENGEKTYLAGDLLTMKNTVDFGCSAMNGTAHIVNNQVVEIVRVYIP